MERVDWNHFAEMYDRVFLEDPMYLETLRLIVDRVESGDKKRIADLGCGTGNLITRILDKFPGAEVTGIDPSPRMREICRLRFNNYPNVEISSGDALDIPFPNNCFDYVMSNHALHHVLPDQREKCAGEIARVLKPGGGLIYSDLFSDVVGSTDDPKRCRDIIHKLTGKALFCLEHGARELMLIILKAIPNMLKEEGEYLTTDETWIGILSSAGFADFQVTDVHPEELGFKIICSTIANTEET